MKKQLTAALLCALSALPLVAEAKVIPSGTSGVINAPSGYVRLPGHVSGGLDWTKEGRNVRGNISLPLGIEIAGSHVDTKHDGSYGTVSAKLQVLRETPVTPAIAIGVEDIADNQNRRGYVAVSKALFAGWKVNAGVGTGDQYKHGFYAVEKETKLLGLSMNLMGEYDGSHFNYGAAVPVGKFIQTEVGVRDKHLYGGMNLTF